MTKVDVSARASRSGLESLRPAPLSLQQFANGALSEASAGSVTFPLACPRPRDWRLGTLRCPVLPGDTREPWSPEGRREAAGSSLSPGGPFCPLPSPGSAGLRFACAFLAPNVLLAASLGIFSPVRALGRREGASAATAQPPLGARLSGPVPRGLADLRPAARTRCPLGFLLHLLPPPPLRPQPLWRESRARGREPLVAATPDPSCRAGAWRGRVASGLWLAEQGWFFPRS